MTHRIKCAEIWGGIRGDVLDVETSGIRASLFWFQIERLVASNTER
jgi:hypothetical protein